MEPLEARVAAFIRANRLFAEAKFILLAVSGGADSVALLNVMKTLTLDKTIKAGLVCAHVNHQLRSKESDQDERFVIDRASDLGLSVVSQSVDVKAYAEMHKLSLETAGRKLRLACFAEIAQAHGGTWIATGHQKDDNAETVLQRLRRGTGFRGLGAIRPARRLEGEIWLARPLLDCTRADILAYLRARDLAWREDHTNTDCTYTRNYVRHRLLPTLQNQSTGSLTDRLSELAASARRLHERVGTEAERAASQCVTADGDHMSINTATLTALPPILAVEVIRLQWPKLGCGEQNLTRRHYESILRLARHPAGKQRVTLPGDYVVHTEYGRLVFRRKAASHRDEANSQSVVLDIPGTATLAGRCIEARILGPSEAASLEIKGDKTGFLEYLDLDRVSRPLVVRGRRPGDRFHPLGLPGEKKLGKFLTAAKVPQHVRQGILVFEDGRNVVWVCPLRISEHVKVTQATRRILMLAVSDAGQP